MARVGTVGSDNNRALSVVGQSLIIGAVAGSANYFLDDQKVHILSKDSFDFASEAGGKIEEAIVESAKYKKLKGNLTGYRDRLSQLEQPARDVKKQHGDISREIAKRIKPLQEDVRALTEANNLAAASAKKNVHTYPLWGL